MHIFGRSENAIKQVFPEAVQLPTIESGFYDDNEPLNDEDINELKRCIEKEEKKDKYNPELWSLV